MDDTDLLMIIAGSGVPAWAAGFDMWANYTNGQGNGFLNFPPGVDTHAQAINALNSGGSYLSYPANVPVRTDLGLQTVPTRTNSIRNNSMVGAVAGTPGTLPTNWATSSTGLTRSIVGTGTENGIPYIDIRFAGTTGATFGSINLDTSTGITAANGQNWTMSSTLSLVGGSLTNVTGPKHEVGQNDSGGAFLSNLTGSVLAITASPTRFSTTFSTNNASTAFVQPRVTFSWTSGVAVDFTIRVAAPQLEGTNVSFASPPILTTSASATVNGNQQVIDLTGKLGVGVSGFVQVNISGAAANDRIFQISDGSNNNRATIFNNAGALNYLMSSGGVSQGQAAVTGPVSGLITIAFAFSTNYIAARVVGQTANTDDTSATYPAMDRMGLGGLGFATTNNIFQFTNKLALKFGSQNASTFAAAFAAAQLAAVSP